MEAGADESYQGEQASWSVGDEVCAVATSVSGRRTCLRVPQGHLQDGRARKVGLLAACSWSS